MSVASDNGPSPDVAPLRERIVAAAANVTSSSGWGEVTMGRLALMTGVSRQTIYNEIGDKTVLADEMIATEVVRFLAGVTRAFDDHPTDLRAAVERAIFVVLSEAESNPLLHAIVSATAGVDSELLPLVTVRSRGLVESATAVLDDLVCRYPLTVDDDIRLGTVDMIVRSVLSHVTQPGGLAARTAVVVARVAVAVLQQPVRPAQPSSSCAAPMAT